MAGLYIHVPFCAKRCLYCDFFSNTEMKYKEPYINALIKEMELRKGYIGNEALETIYFGGGTPSQLDEKDFGKIFEAIYRLFDVAEQAEITLEANLYRFSVIILLTGSAWVYRVFIRKICVF